MALEIFMPALSPTMEEGTLAKWLVAEGDRVQSGDLLAEIETDKATMEFEAVDEGVIGKLLVTEGTANVKVNSAIAILLEEGDAADATASPAQSTAAAAPLVMEASTAKAPAPTAAPSAAPAAAKSNDGTRIFASPLARRIAADQGLDLAKITGSGPKGRIIKADVSGAPATASVYAAATMAPAPVASATAPSPVSAASVEALYQGRSYKTLSLDGMRRVIADRLSEAKQTIPHFYLRRDIQLDTLLKLRSEMNAGLEARGVRLSVNDFIIKACAMALQSVPAANAVWAGDHVLQMEASDISVAVAIEGGLFTPVLLDADSKSLSKLAVEMKDLAARARSRKLAPHEYQGGSFSISNLGMMGIDNFDAVINPPQGAILAVGAGKKRPIVGADGTLSVATVMSVTMSVDHRVIDGALGAELLNAIVNNLEHPLSMLV
ncbi:pyruvate dehydrogenase complex dihydrolipoamide acetyltransferase [Planktomarina sp.]|uniref:pyruvate dehydrogenase complex dihydrolipoamide acetyltransferase n=1 Tax=Planktomarina sp. TaxID=2024851 RepID=UPI002890FE2D|nr:pyruvate dehydrogenase complex dihydrolipoamide acetyltransferase [Planktomarina sp.]